LVIAGLDPAIPVHSARHCHVIEMPATSAGMTAWFSPLIPPPIALGGKLQIERDAETGRLDRLGDQAIDDLRYRTAA
jgi:hypothetical protein